MLLQTRNFNKYLPYQRNNFKLKMCYIVPKLLFNYNLNNLVKLIVTVCDKNFS